MTSFPEGDPAQHLVEEVLFRAAKKAGKIPYHFQTTLYFKKHISFSCSGNEQHFFDHHSCFYYCRYGFP